MKLIENGILKFIKLKDKIVIDNCDVVCGEIEKADKMKYVCEEIGVEFEEFLLEESTTMEKLLNLIDELNNRADIHGILLQSPIPKHSEE